MSYSHLALAALGGTVACFAFGSLVFWLVPETYATYARQTAALVPYLF